MKTFGERLRELRQERDLSLRDLAKRLGKLTAPYLSDIELGRRYPSEAILKKLAEVLGAPLEELRALDPRPPVDDLKRLGEKDPKLAYALRQMVDQKVSGKDLAELLDKLQKKKSETR